jgi:hypothetical protein
MGEVLGVGLTHFPAFLGGDDRMATALRHMLDAPGFPEDRRDPAAWPLAMRQEWGDDEGLAAAARHRRALVAGLRRVRAAVDAFNPDAVVVMGDDQYENFREDLVPPFCVLAYEDMEVRPFESTRFGPNPWGEPPETVVAVRGDRQLGKALVAGLLGQGVDMAYAYRPGHHPGLAHAFLNTVLFLDYDRAGFDWPLVPVAINCYGRRLTANRGVFPNLADPPAAEDLDPPSPHPFRCFEVGRALARVLGGLPGRYVLAASASWSHGFLCEATGYLHPAVDVDRALFGRLQAGDWQAFGALDLADVERYGHHELLNWVVLAGAMAELGRVPQWCELVESHVFNSDKVFAVVGPGDAR